MSELILGGVKSGKSRFAQQLAEESGLNVIYFATAEAKDLEMQQRIRHHQSNRPADWTLVEEPYELSSVIEPFLQTESCLLIDCLSVWVCNLLCADKDNTIALVQEKINDFVSLLEKSRLLNGRIILVGNESNMGVIPLGELSRQYCDEIGLLYQRLAQISDTVTLMVAGLPMELKGMKHD